MILGEVCVDKAMHRHVGVMEEVYTPMGTLYNQIGKDLSKVGFVIGTGGILIKAHHSKEILSKVLSTRENILELRPVYPKFMIDKDYILASMGLLSKIDPLLALKIMKKHIKEI